MRPIDFDVEVEMKQAPPPFDPRDYSAEELNLIEAALKLVQARQQAESALAPVGPE